MGKNNNILEINGKRYDAKTGAHLGHTAPAHHSARPKNVDGVVAAKKPAHHPRHNVAAGAQVPVKTAPRRMDDVVRHSSAMTAKRQLQPAKTLMRTSVAKPEHSLKRQLKAQGQAAKALTKKPSATLQAKGSVARLDEKRLQHAKHVPKSQFISRFGAPVTSKTPSLQTGSVSFEPQLSLPQQTTAIAVPPSKRPKTTADILEQALQHASSHTEPRIQHKKRTSRTKQITGISLATLSILLVVGFVATQSITSIRLRVASAKAGFSAALPAQRPAGYSISNMKYSPGFVNVHFQSNSDNRQYDITEKTSSWDSAGLRDSFVAPQSKDYKTVDAAGRTIYIYGEGNATWVSNNIWYQVRGADSLSDQQLVDLAASL